MDSTRTSPIYQHWPSESEGRKHIDKNISPCANFMVLDENQRLQLCRDASIKIHKSLRLHEGDLPLPFIADHCWPLWTQSIRRPCAELHLPFIFLDPDKSAVPAKLIFQEIRDQACSGALYPAGEMQGVQTDAEWDGAIEAALYHADQNGFPIPKTSDLRWRVVLDQTPPVQAKRITGRSAGVTFLLALYHHFGKVAEWNTRHAFESIIALAALPTRDQAKQALIHLGGDESKKAQALQGLGQVAGTQTLHVVLAGSFSGFDNVGLPASAKIHHAETVEQLRHAIQEIIRSERASALERPQALDFDHDITEKRRGFVGREWLFEKIDLWRHESAESTERALLIKGDPGAGKSSLVAQWVHANPGGQVIGFHFCHFDLPETVRPARFVQSLAAILASRLPAYREQFDKASVKEALSAKRCEASPGDAFQEGILKPLRRLPAPEGGVKYILVDALDEGLAYKGGPSLVDMLASHIERFPPWLRLVATTRNDPAVLQRLSGLRAKHILASDPRNLEDLAHYIRQRLVEPSLAERLASSHVSAEVAVECISRKSSGNFLYAAQVLDSIARDFFSFANLDALPRGLDGIYLACFRRLFGHEGTEACESAYMKAKPLLQILCAAAEPLSRSELAAASGLDPEQEVPPLLRKLSQMLSRQIRPPGEETIAFFHKSVADWLTDNSDGNAFAVSPTKGHKGLADFCRTAVSNFVTHLPGYARKHAVHHLLQLDDWEGASEILTDIGYLELRASHYELASIRFHYYLLSKKLELQATTDFEAQATLLRVLSFQKFVASYMAALHQFGHLKNFFCQHAYLLSSENESKGLQTEAIAEAGLKKLKTRAAARAIIQRRFCRGQNAPSLDETSPRARTLTDLNQFRHALNRAGISARDINESNGRIAIGDGALFCAIGSSLADVDPFTWQIAIRERHATRYLGKWARENTGSQSFFGLTLLHAEQSKSLQIGAVLGPFIDLAFTYCSTHLLCLRFVDLMPLKIDPVTKDSTQLYSFRGSRLAVAGGANRAATLDRDTIKIWDPETEKLILQINSDIGFHSLALSPSGEHVMAWTDRNLAIWDSMTGIMTCELHSNPWDILHAALDSSGSLLATACKDGIARIWNVRNRTVIAELSGHEGGIRSVHLNDQGTWLYTWGEDQTIRVWRISDQACVLLLFQPGACRFSARPDEQLIAVGFPDETVEIYEIQNLDGVASTSTAPHLAPARAPTRIGQ